MAEIIHRNRPLTSAECERAMSVSRGEYPQDMPCCVCGFRWMQHRGTLCPKRPGYWRLDPLLGYVPEPPIYADTTFLPDVQYYNRNPDFDVV